MAGASATSESLALHRLSGERRVGVDGGWTTDHAHASLTAGYRLSFLIATGLARAALAFVAAQLNARACQTELARQQK